MAADVPMPPSLGVDTSLTPQSTLVTGQPTGLAGIDSTANDNPWGETMFSVPSAEEFTATFPKGSSKFADVPNQSANGSLRGDVVAYAKQFLGMQYKWGGSNPNTSFDCSGFVQYVLKHFGVSAPRVSFQQARFGKEIALSQAQPGDLIAWDNSSRNDGADHIALYIGNGKIMEFYRTGKPSRIRQLGSKENYWAVQIKYPGER